MLWAHTVHERSVLPTLFSNPKASQLFSDHRTILGPAPLPLLLLLQAGDASDSDPRNQDMASLLTTLIEIATAMVYLHLQGLVHCDLKPVSHSCVTAPPPAPPFPHKLYTV